MQGLLTTIYVRCQKNDLNWAASWHNQQSGMSTQQRLRSAWASAQSDQESSLCAQWVANNPGFLHADSEDSDQTGRTCRFIGFVVRRLGYF